VFLNLNFKEEIMKKKNFEIEDLGTTELPEEVHLMAVEKIKEADEEIEQMRMQIRWGIKQIKIIKQAAALMGIPYQTYVKQALFHQAIEDIKNSERLMKIKA